MTTRPPHGKAMKAIERSIDIKDLATEDALDPHSFRSPIDFLAAEHKRQLAICDLLDHLKRNPRHAAACDELTRVRDYLVRELPLHTEDEEQDLFPALARRCPSSDEIETVFSLLRLEHDCDRTLVADLVAALDALIDGHALPDPAAFLANARAVSETQRRHLAWENTVILPRARRHLNSEDLTARTEAMAARRAAKPVG